MVLTLFKRYPVVRVYIRIPKGVFAFLEKGFESENVGKRLYNYATKLNPQAHRMEFGGQLGSTNTVVFRMKGNTNLRL
jgi:hypothetical protein